MTQVTSKQNASMNTLDTNGRFEFTVWINGPAGRIVDIPGYCKFTIPAMLRLWDGQEKFIKTKLKELGITDYNISHPRCEDLR
jgi:hypothetical protein